MWVPDKGHDLESRSCRLALSEGRSGIKSILSWSTEYKIVTANANPNMALKREIDQIVKIINLSW